MSFYHVAFRLYRGHIELDDSRNVCARDHDEDEDGADFKSFDSFQGSARNFLGPVQMRSWKINCERDRGSH